MSKRNVIVCNKRSDHGLGVYVGRPSPLGNPFRAGRDGTREEVIEAYREWLRTRIDAGDMRVIAALNQLAILSERAQGVKLVCWCAPLPCHADVIAEEVEGWPVV